MPYYEIYNRYKRGQKLNKFGRVIAGTTFAPVAFGGFYRTPTALTSLEIVSTSTSDTSAGVGGRTVLVQGAGANYQQTEEEVTLNGTTPVALANQYYRIYRAYVHTSGRYATSATPSHVGNITIRETGGGQSWATIDDAATYARGQTQIACYTIPVNTELYIDNIKISADSTKVIDVILLQRQQIDVITAPFNTMRLVQEYDGVSNTSSLDYNDNPLGPFPEKTDIIFMAKLSVGTGSVSVEFNGRLLKTSERPGA